MLTVEFNKQKGSVEVYGDAEGLKLLAKRIMALVRKDPGSYIAHGQGIEPRHHRENTLADYYTIFLCETREEVEVMGPPPPNEWPPCPDGT